MIKAKLQLEAFSVQCPHCGEGIENDFTGSLLWTLHDGDIDTGIKAGQVAVCQVCGEMSELPAVVHGNKLPKV